jgi:YHS domain-containing protein
MKVEGNIQREKTRNDLWGAPDWGMQDHWDGAATVAVDPVCGARVDEARAPEKTGYAGEMFYFCSTNCKVKFQEDPGSYIGQRRTKR